jgi:hypothetical protein
MKKMLLILFIGIGVFGCDTNNPVENLEENDEIQITIDKFIHENNDSCLEHFYKAINFAYAEELEKSSQELSFFQKCSKNNEIKGSYPDAIEALNAGINLKDIRRVKFTVEMFIPILDSLKYDSLSLFMPSEPYTVTVSN